MAIMHKTFFNCINKAKRFAKQLASVVVIAQLIFKNWATQLYQEPHTPSKCVIIEEKIPYTDCQTKTWISVTQLMKMKRPLSLNMSFHLTQDIQSMSTNTTTKHFKKNNFNAIVIVIDSHSHTKECIKMCYHKKINHPRELEKLKIK